jgi:hypothetical protein
MRGKLLFVAGLAVGYVLGTRAGRQRYEQIKVAAKNVWESEPVQWAAGQAQDAVADVADKAVAQARKVIAQVSGESAAGRGRATAPPAPRIPTAEPAVRGTSPMTAPITTIKPDAAAAARATAKPRTPKATPGA